MTEKRTAMPTPAPRRCQRLLAMLAVVCAPHASALTLLAEDFPPLNYSNDGGQTVIGASTDLLREALHRSGTRASIEMHPWRYAYKQALEAKDTCVFSTSRTETREPLFKWVGPLSQSQWVLYARADSPIRPTDSLATLKSYVVGGYQGDARTLYLKEQGFTVDEAQTEQQSLKKLEARRVDLWSATSNSGPWNAKQLGIAIKPIIAYREGQASYAACNLSVPDELIARLNAALSAMRADGTQKRLQDPYYQSK